MQTEVRITLPKKHSVSSPSVHRNKDRQIEEAAEKNEGELKFYRQKIKHLQFEHQNDLTEAKAEALVSLKMAEDSHNEQERQLLRDKKNLKRAVHETEFSHQEQLRGIKLVHQTPILIY